MSRHCLPRSIAPVSSMIVGDRRCGRFFLSMHPHRPRRPCRPCAAPVCISATRSVDLGVVVLYACGGRAGAVVVVYVYIQYTVYIYIYTYIHTHTHRAHTAHTRCTLHTHSLRVTSLVTRHSSHITTHVLLHRVGVGFDLIFSLHALTRMGLLETPGGGSRTRNV